MKKSGLMGALFAGILATTTLSANALERIENGTDHYVLQQNENLQVTTRTPHAAPNGHGSAERGVLDLAFVVGSALLGFLLLRKVNNG
jgi:hypothetical protein